MMNKRRKLYRKISRFRFSPIMRVTEKDVSWSNMMFAFHHVTGVWDDKMFNSQWGSSWVGHSKLFSQLGNTWNRWLINNCLVVYDNIRVFAVKYEFDKSLTTPEITKFVKSRVTLKLL